MAPVADASAREIIAQVEQDWSEFLGARDFATLRALLQRLHVALWPPNESPPT